MASLYTHFISRANLGRELVKAANFSSGKSRGMNLLVVELK